MNRPSELEDLLKELKIERPRSSVGRHSESKLVIINEDGDPGFELNSEEAPLVLSSPETAELFFDAMDIDDVSIELHGLDVPHDTLTVLESHCCTVDEM